MLFLRAEVINCLFCRRIAVGCELELCHWLRKVRVVTVIIRQQLRSHYVLRPTLCRLPPYLKVYLAQTHKSLLLDLIRRLAISVRVEKKASLSRAFRQIDPWSLLDCRCCLQLRCLELIMERLYMVTWLALRQMMDWKEESWFFLRIRIGLYFD